MKQPPVVEFAVPITYNPGEKIEEIYDLGKGGFKVD